MTLSTRHAPTSRFRFLVASAALLGGAAAGCYGSELDGQAPEVTTSPDATDTSAETDGTSPDVEVGETSAPDGDTSPDTDTVVVPPMWETLGLGDVGAIGDLVVIDDDLAYAVSGTRVIRWNGATWLAYGEPGGEAALRGVWAGAGEDGGDVVVVVGAGGLVARRADGEDWEVVDAGTTVDLWDVDGRGVDDLYVVGDKATVRHWDGEAWSDKFTKDTLDLRSAWVDRKKSGDEGVFAVGTGGQLVSFDATGQVWKAAQIAGNGVTLWDILQTGDGTLIAAGTDHTITARRPVDVTWRGQATNDGAERDVFALAETDDGKVWAFGADGLVLQQAGTTWGTVQAAQVAAGLQDFAAAAVAPGKDGALVVVASGGGGVRRSGGAWAAFATRPEAAVKDLEAAPDGTLWAVGSHGLLMSRGDDGWSAHALPGSLRTVDLEAVTVTPSGVVFAVGEGGAIVKKVDDEPARALTSPVPLDLFGVASNADGVIACGRGGTLVTIDDEDATGIRASGSVADLRAIAYGGDGALWIAGSIGTLLRATGAGLPALVESQVGVSLNDLAATDDGVLAVGDSGIVLAATAAEVELAAETPGVFLQGVAARDGARWAVGWNGVIVRDDGGAWVSEASGTNLILEAIWLGADEALAAGRQGILLRRLEAP